jgi:hypothetical protein
MTDVIFIVTIVAFFVAGAFLVRALDHMIAHAGLDADSDDEACVPEPGTGRAQ